MKKKLEFWEIDDIKTIERNLKLVKNLSALGLNASELYAQIKGNKRGNLNIRRQYEFTIAWSLVSDLKLFKKGLGYIGLLDKSTGAVTKKYPEFRPFLKRIIEKNFAEYGITIELMEFMAERNIKIISMEPLVDKEKLNGKRLDMEIFTQRSIVIECHSPIESVSKGKELTDLATQKLISKFGRRNNYDYPFILTISFNNTITNNMSNRGCISNELFSPIKNIQAKNPGPLIEKFLESNPVLSALFVKYDSNLSIIYNKHATNLIQQYEKNMFEQSSIFIRLKQLWNHHFSF